MSMTYSVLGRPPNNAYPPHSLEYLRKLSVNLAAALALLPRELDGTVPARYAYNIDQLVMLLHEADHAIPFIGDVWLCGYSWGHDGHAWTTWSGHESKATAVRWLEAWKASELGRHDNWEVRFGDCVIGCFMPKGTRSATVLKRLGS